MRHMIIEAVNAMRSPSMNGPEISSGERLPVMSAAFAGGSCDSVCLPTSFSIGL